MCEAELKLLPQGVQRVAHAVPLSEPALNAPELMAARALLAMASTDTVPSPCISVCRMTESTGLCEGCFRTLDEIGQWSGADAPAKRLIWARIEQRLTKSRS